MVDFDVLTMTQSLRHSRAGVCYGAINSRCVLVYFVVCAVVRACEREEMLYVPVMICYVYIDNLGYSSS